MKIDRLINKNMDFELPYLVFEGWRFSIKGLVSPEGVTYTPSSIQLLKWKSGFYDRGVRALDTEKERLYPR